ncbi:HNH endonuclease signature motif containing protein, partial [Promicromonospora sukumoe]|uniref:HNH endonuclease signature motif containing protein n=1 Tax=Promicromonospora sukumoe TaxID=88382 RepID=UPI003652A13E
CDQPPSRCEVHHAVTHWAQGGDTSVSNSALLCWFHHQLVDARGIAMAWAGKPTTSPTRAGVLVETGWVFTDARGHRIRLPEAIEPAPDSGGPGDQAGTPPAVAA